jgi:hypothetical protein
MTNSKKSNKGKGGEMKPSVSSASTAPPQSTIINDEKKEEAPTNVSLIVEEINTPPPSSSVSPAVEAPPPRIPPPPIPSSSDWTPAVPNDQKRPDPPPLDNYDQQSTSPTSAVRMGYSTPLNHPFGNMHNPFQSVNVQGVVTSNTFTGNVYQDNTKPSLAVSTAPPTFGTPLAIDDFGRSFRSPLSMTPPLAQITPSISYPIPYSAVPTTIAANAYYGQERINPSLPPFNLAPPPLPPQAAPTNFPTTGHPNTQSPIPSNYGDRFLVPTPPPAPQPVQPSQAPLPLLDRFASAPIDPPQYAPFLQSWRVSTPNTREAFSALAQMRQAQALNQLIQQLAEMRVNPTAPAAPPIPPARQQRERMSLEEKQKREEEKKIKQEKKEEVKRQKDEARRKREAERAEKKALWEQKKMEIAARKAERANKKLEREQRLKEIALEEQRQLAAVRQQMQELKQNTPITDRTRLTRIDQYFQRSAAALARQMAEQRVAVYQEAANEEEANGLAEIIDAEELVALTREEMEEEERKIAEESAAVGANPEDDGEQEYNPPALTIPASIDSTMPPQQPFLTNLTSAHPDDSAKFNNIIDPTPILPAQPIGRSPPATVRAPQQGILDSYDPQYDETDSVRQDEEAPHVRNLHDDERKRDQRINARPYVPSTPKPFKGIPKAPPPAMPFTKRSSRRPQSDSDDEEAPVEPIANPNPVQFTWSPSSETIQKVSSELLRFSRKYTLEFIAKAKIDPLDRFNESKPDSDIFLTIKQFQSWVGALGIGFNQRIEQRVFTYLFLTKCFAAVSGAPNALGGYVDDGVSWDSFLRYLFEWISVDHETHKQKIMDLKFDYNDKTASIKTVYLSLQQLESALEILRHHTSSGVRLSDVEKSDHIKHVFLGDTTDMELLPPPYLGSFRDEVIKLWAKFSERSPHIPDQRRQQRFVDELHKLWEVHKKHYIDRRRIGHARITDGRESTTSYTRTYSRRNYNYRNRNQEAIPPNTVVNTFRVPSSSAARVGKMVDIASVEEEEDSITSDEEGLDDNMYETKLLARQEDSSLMRRVHLAQSADEIRNIYTVTVNWVQAAENEKAARRQRRVACFVCKQDHRYADCPYREHVRQLIERLIQQKEAAQPHSAQNNKIGFSAANSTPLPRPYDNSRTINNNTNNISSSSGATSGEGRNILQKELSPAQRLANQMKPSVSDAHTKATPINENPNMALDPRTDELFNNGTAQSESNTITINLGNMNPGGVISALLAQRYPRLQRNKNLVPAVGANLPVASFRIANQWVDNILLDTGANGNVMSLPFLQQLSRKKGEWQSSIEFKPINGLSATGIGGSVKIIGVAKILISDGPRRLILTDFIIVENLPQQIILGSPFMKHVELSREISRMKIGVFHEPMDDPSTPHQFPIPVPAPNAKDPMYLQPEVSVWKNNIIFQPNGAAFIAIQLPEDITADTRLAIRTALPFRDGPFEAPHQIVLARRGNQFGQTFIEVRNQTDTPLALINNFTVEARILQDRVVLHALDFDDHESRDIHTYAAFINQLNDAQIIERPDEPDEQNHSSASADSSLRHPIDSGISVNSATSAESLDEWYQLLNNDFCLFDNEWFIGADRL